MDYQRDLSLLQDIIVSPSNNSLTVPVFDFGMEGEVSSSDGEIPYQSIVVTSEEPFILDYESNKMTEFIGKPSEMVQPDTPALDSTFNFDMITLDPFDYNNLPVLVEDSDQPFATEWNRTLTSVPNLNNSDGPCLVTQAFQSLDNTPVLDSVLSNTDGPCLVNQALQSLDNTPVLDSVLSNTDGPCLVTQALQSVDNTPDIDLCNYFNSDQMAVTLKQSFERNQEMSLKAHVIPAEVFDQEKVVDQELKPKKRGRKPKSETGAAPRQRRRQRTVKVYNLPPLEDEEKEKKRKNAINAKRHRDMAKNKLIEVEQSLAEVTEERDRLRQEVEKLRQKEAMLQQLLRNN